jgi:hypothetical protein
MPTAPTYGVHVLQLIRDVPVSYVYPANIQDTSEAINLWVIVGSVIGALVVFVVLGVILWKVSMPIRVIFIKYYINL